MPVEASEVGIDWVGSAAVWQCWCGRRRSGGADTRAYQIHVLFRDRAVASRSWEVPVALSGTTY
jgi:hypothetical protein